jgi:hypothetical protein
MRRLVILHALLLGSVAPILLALSYFKELHVSHGRFESLPITGLTLTQGELRLGRAVSCSPIENNQITYGARWRIDWARWDAPRATIMAQYVALTGKDSCCGTGLHYDDLFISSAFPPPAQTIQIKNVSFRLIRAPFWPILLLTSVFPAFFVRTLAHKRFRKVRGFCADCGYSLTGNTSGVCPECGTRVNSHIDARAG